MREVTDSSKARKDDNNDFSVTQTAEHVSYIYIAAIKLPFISRKTVFADKFSYGPDRTSLNHRFHFFCVSN